MKLHADKFLNVGTGLSIILVPWIIILGCVSSVVTLITFTLTAIGIACLGQLVLKGISTPLTNEDRAFLALPTGYLTVSCLIALGLRTGISLTTLIWMVSILALIGLFWTVLRRDSVYCSRMQGLWGLMALTSLIALIYFLPGAIRDAVYLRDGSYNWMYVDTQYQCAIATRVKTCIGAPKMPDIGLFDLYYHYGPYTIAGALSAAFNIPVGDAVVRVVRPIALLSLLLSSYTFGRFLGRASGRETVCGLCAATSLFFYGSLASLFANNVNSSSLVSGAILFKIPYLEVSSSGGPFSHLLLGHSELHGLSGLFVLLVLLLAKLSSNDARFLAPDLFLLGPAALFPTNLLLGIAFSGLTVVLLMWFGARHRRVWFAVAVVMCTSFFSMWAMGSVGSPMTGRLVFAPLQLLSDRLFEFFVWFHIGLGLRLYVFARLKNPLRDPVSAAVVIFSMGFLSLSLLFQDNNWGNTRYGFLFLQATLSVIAFAWLPLSAKPDPSAGGHQPPYAVIATLLRTTLFSCTAFLVCGMLLYLHQGAAHANFPVIATIKASIFLLLLASAGLLMVSKTWRLRPLVGWLAISIYLWGFTAWITDWVNFGLGRMKMDVTISPGEVMGLDQVRMVAEKGALIATNQHNLPGFRYGSERSYAYGALSEHPVLLEGWLSGGAKNLPQFGRIKAADDLLFSTTDVNIVRDIVREFNIRFIVAKPNTDLALPKPFPNWLSRVSNTGTLHVYRVMLNRNG